MPNTFLPISVKKFAKYLQPTVSSIRSIGISTAAKQEERRVDYAG